ncbi:hypothetical protein K439DRAFT_1348407 [Ramaria rubella]|nr:hypothetical protein K439DRAFT_1348407 [Ramaria rubella]
MSTATAPAEASRSNPFAPSSKTINTSSASQSERTVTIPHIRGLYQPIDKTLDALFPHVIPSKPYKLPPNPSPTEFPFMDALKTTQNRTTTTNDADAYKSTLSCSLDAFSSLGQNMDSRDIPGLLTDSWKSDPTVTLRIIWNLRSIHEGKSARESFYRAFAWLYQEHPKTAIGNLRFLVEPCVKRTIKKKPQTSEVEEDIEVVSIKEVTRDEMQADPEEETITVGMPHGYWKDLLNLLLLAAKNELHPLSPLDALHSRGHELKLETFPKGETPEQRIQLALARNKAKADAAKESRFQKQKVQHEALTRKLAEDTSFRALYITVARLYTDALARDVKILRQIADENTNAERRVALAYELSLVGKWAPSIGGSHDRATNIVTAIAELLYSEAHLPLPIAPLEQPLTQDVAHKLRSAYTRWVVSPLRRFLQIPEVAMSARQWDKIKYTRVPSKCMQMNKKHFFKRDAMRFSRYLMDVAQGRKKISGATLLPNQLLSEAMRYAHPSLQGWKGTNEAEIQIQVIEAQWKSMVDRIKESGSLDNALAVCDVSGSMGSLGGNPNSPICPAVALSIILAQVSRPPWGNNFITFSQQPEIVSLNPNDGLAEIAWKMSQTSWGMNTDFNAIFTKLILPMAIEHKIKPEDMVKRLFVFSDMQFDASRGQRGQTSEWKTEHQIIKEKFSEAGYEVPEIVYWNLAGSVSKPITKDEEGVALLSGFSPGLLKIFLGEETAEEEVQVETKTEEEGEFEEVTKVAKKKLDPVDTMIKALGKESFAGLTVLD